jgi:protein-arginine kinase
MWLFLEKKNVDITAQKKCRYSFTKKCGYYTSEKNVDIPRKN